MNDQNSKYNNPEEREYEKLTNQHRLLFGESLSWHRFAVGLIAAAVYGFFDKTGFIGSIVLSLATIF